MQIITQTTYLKVLSSAYITEKWKWSTSRSDQCSTLSHNLKTSPEHLEMWLCASVICPVSWVYDVGWNLSGRKDRLLTALLRNAAQKNHRRWTDTMWRNPRTFKRLTGNVILFRSSLLVVCIQTQCRWSYGKGLFLPDSQATYYRIGKERRWDKHALTVLGVLTVCSDSVSDSSFSVFQWPV